MLMTGASPLSPPRSPALPSRRRQRAPARPECPPGWKRDPEKLAVVLKTKRGKFALVICVAMASVVSISSFHRLDIIKLINGFKPLKRSAA